MKASIFVQLAMVLKREYSLSNPTWENPDDGIEGNTLIVTNDAHKCVIKLFNNHKQAQTVAAFQHQLYTANLLVPAITPTNNGELTVKLGSTTIVMSEFIDGVTIGWGKEFSELSGSINASLANALGGIHKASQSIPVSMEMGHSLSIEHIIHQVEGKLAVGRLREDLQYTRKAMIHADLARENIFLDESHTHVRAIIDFGDAHLDYLTYDIATLLTQVYVTKSWGVDFEAIEEFMGVYLKLNPLERRELQTIVPLMKLRNLGLLHEIEQKLREGDTDSVLLESIRQSLEVKLRLLEEQSAHLEDTIQEALV
jgi:Ser/Thr protein kinase RdoA (MazF antagonist)